MSAGSHPTRGGKCNQGLLSTHRRLPGPSGFGNQKTADYSEMRGWQCKLPSKREKLFFLRYKSDPTENHPKNEMDITLDLLQKNLNCY